MGLIVFGTVFSSLFAEGGQDNQYADNLDSAGQDLEEARSRVMDLRSFYSSDDQKKRYSENLKKYKLDIAEMKKAIVNLKALYAERDGQYKEITTKFNKINDNLRDCQDSVEQLNKEKESLSGQQSALALQLKAAETEKFILQQQNQIFANCSKENEAKTNELNVLRTSYAQDKKDFLNKIQKNEEKITEITQQRDILSQKKSELEVKYSVISQQVEGIKGQNSGCAEQKEALMFKVQELESEVDILRKKLNVAQNNSQELEEVSRQIKKQEGFEEELKELRRKCARLEAELKSALTQNSQLSEIALKYDKQVNFQQDLALVRGNLLAVENENQRLRSIAAKYEKQELSKNEFRNLRAELKKSEEQKSQIQQACDKIRKQEEELEAKFMDLTKKLSVLQEENKRLLASSPKLSEEKIISDEISRLREELAKCKEGKTFPRLDVLADKSASWDESKLREEIIRLKLENKALKGGQFISGTKGDSGKIDKLTETLKASQELSYQLVQEKAGYEKREKELNQKLLESQKERIILGQKKAETMARNKELEIESAKVSEELAKTMVKLNEVEKQKQVVLGKSEDCLREVKFLQDKLKSSEQLAASFQVELAAVKKINQDLEAKVINSKVQNEQDVALTKAQMEKLSTFREGEYVQLNNKFQEYRVQKEMEIKSLNDSFAKLKAELQNSQEISFQMVQEKNSLQGQQKQISDQLKELQGQKTLIEQRKLDLEKQSVFLKNQYVASSQELETLKKEVVSLSKGRAPAEFEAYRKELEFLKSQLEEKDKEYRSKKEMEIKALNDSLAKLKAQLQNSQEISFQMVQEKNSLQGQQKQISDQFKELQSQKTLLEQRKLDLEKQNVFLKNQYIVSSQELDAFKKEVTSLSKGRVPAEFEACRKELEFLKSQLEEKDKDYLAKIKEYETKYKDISGSDKDKSALINDLAKLRNNYEELQKRFNISEESRKALEAVKERYGKLPEENAKLHYNLGVVYAQQKEYSKAAGELERVIELKPNDAEAFYNLGVVYGEYLGNRKKAVGYFEKYLALSPDDSEADRIRKYILTWKTLGQELNDK